MKLKDQLAENTARYQEALDQVVEDPRPVTVGNLAWGLDAGGLEPHERRALAHLLASKGRELQRHRTDMSVIEVFDHLFGWSTLDDDEGYTDWVVRATGDGDDELSFAYSEDAISYLMGLPDVPEDEESVA